MGGRGSRLSRGPEIGWALNASSFGACWRAMVRPSAKPKRDYVSSVIFSDEIRIDRRHDPGSEFVFLGSHTRRGLCVFPWAIDLKNQCATGILAI
jgi:hypothetical protein